MKQCKKCLKIKSEKEFSKDKIRKDGLFCYCKTCCKKYYKDCSKDWYDKYKKENGETPSNKWQRENREKVNKTAREKFKNRDKDDYNKKRNCRLKTHRLLKQRKVKNQPCIICGDNGTVHHNNYNNPYDIDWYCRKHHSMLHRYNLQKENIYI